MPLENQTSQKQQNDRKSNPISERKLVLIETVDGEEFVHKIFNNFLELNRIER